MIVDNTCVHSPSSCCSYCLHAGCVCWVQNPHLVNNPTKRSRVDATLNYKHSTNQQNDDCSSPCSTKLLTGTGRITMHDEAQQHEDECTAMTEHLTDLFNPETRQSAQKTDSHAQNALGTRTNTRQNNEMVMKWLVRRATCTSSFEKE